VISSIRLRVGILGVGSIGKALAEALDAKRIDAELVAISDQNEGRAEAVAAKLAIRPCVVSLHELIQRSDIVVEAASQSALLDFVPKALTAGRDMLIMSVGGLLGHEHWFHQAMEKGCRIYVPSGAIAGLDGIKSASMGYVRSAVLTSRKPIAALRGSQYVMEHNIPLESFQVETVIFEGTAEEAAGAFPTTSNVAASLRLAMDRTVPVSVRIVAVPGGSKNVHEIRVQGEFGRLSVDVENEPSKENPRTSQLAAFSAIATLANLTRSLRVGT
jgi:aspartate dehydrogenase